MPLSATTGLFHRRFSVNMFITATPGRTMWRLFFG